MTSSSSAVPSDEYEENEESDSLDSTCPECGTDSIATYIDRYSSYEYCTNCDWSDEDSDNNSHREPIVRRDRGRSNE
jgi:hypothetical protein